MKYLQFNCTKCGYPLEGPDKVVQIYCGSCGTINYPGGFFSKLKKTSGYEDNDDGGFYHNSKKGGESTSVKKMPADLKDIFSEMTKSENQQEAGSPKAGVFITILFILLPFIIMIAEVFSIPIIFIVAAIIIIFTAALILRKRS